MKTYNRKQYFIELANLLDSAKKGDKVIIASMSFGPDDKYVKRVVESIKTASNNGANVTLLVDANSFLAPHFLLPGPLFFRKKLTNKMSKFYLKKYQALESIRQSGGEYVVLNMPKRRFSVTFAGRSHMKFAVFNDKVFIGGCNLDNHEHDDLMICIKSKNLSKNLYKFSQKLLKNPNVNDVLKSKHKTIKVDNNSRVLIDAGVKNDSIIFDEGLKLIDEATEFVYFTCQYFPNEITIRKLYQAHKRGVDVRIFYNNPTKRGFPAMIIHFFVKYYYRVQMPKKIFRYELKKSNNFMHAKLLITEKSMVIGSHNFIKTGVRVGTAEIAYISAKTKNKKILNKLGIYEISDI